MRILWVASLFMLSCAASTAGNSDTAQGEKMTPEVVQVVEAQVEAYNRGELEDFASYYAEDVKLYEFPDEVTTSGIEDLRTVYGPLFAREPDLHARITKRIIQGNFVIDHEHVTGSWGSATAVAIYEVVDRKIQNVWFID